MSTYARSPRWSGRLPSLFSYLVQGGMTLVLGMWLVHALTHRGWEQIVAVIVQAFVVVTALFDPLLALVAGLILAPFAPFWHFDISLGAGVPDLSLIRVMVLTTGFIILARLTLGKYTLPPFGWVEVGMLLFVGSMVLATRMALKGPIYALQTVFDAYIIPFSMYLMARILVTDRERLRVLLYGLLFIGVMIAVVVFLEAWAGLMAFYPWGRPGLYSPSLKRITSFFGNPVYHAMIFAVLLPLFVYFYEVAEVRWQGWLFLAGGGVVLGAMSILYTRAGYLATFISLLLLAIPFPRWRRWFWPGFLMGLILLVVFWQRVSHSALFVERLTYTTSVEARTRSMEVAWQFWKESPIFGIGYPNYGILALQRGYLRRIDDKWIPTPHNTFLGILSQAGILALVGYGIMLWNIGRELLGYFRRWRTRTTPAVHRAYLAWATFSSFIAYLTIISTIDADPAQYSNMVFYTLLGGVLGYLARESVRPGEVM
ncbi:MAG: O-antigen ligase family protein [Chloroflexi bacterium]|nr:O-antigen ligase family protein [Chloroflexota bacterium]